MKNLNKEIQSLFIAIQEFETSLSMLILNKKLTESEKRKVKKLLKRIEELKKECFDSNNLNVSYRDMVKLLYLLYKSIVFFD